MKPIRTFLIDLQNEAHNGFCLYKLHFKDLISLINDYSKTYKLSVKKILLSVYRELKKDSQTEVIKITILSVHIPLGQ